ncbi:helix-turn-helix transcriptional regulator [Yersinia enterocolitica]|uniref:AraC family transcriptional regulator n=1 Tax=Yersinia enterocolitica TaxID=630 RepID=UPI00398CCAE0
MEKKLNKIFLSSKNEDSQSMITSNGMKLHSCALLYINSIAICELYCNGERVKSMSKGALLFVDRDTTLSIKSKRSTAQSSYYLYILSDDELQSAYEWLHSYSSPKNIQHKTTSPNLFMFILNGWEKNLFLELNKKKLPIQKKHAILNYLISNMPNNDILFFLLSLNLKNSFSSRTRKIILSNISNNWRISDVSDIINMSESTIKKKLYSENYTFKSLLLETRMNHAAKAILTTDKHINVIASSVGYSNPSYFIKAFKDYFNITPKQLSIQLKKGGNTNHFNKNSQYIKTLPD